MMLQKDREIDPKLNSGFNKFWIFSNYLTNSFMNVILIGDLSKLDEREDKFLYASSTSRFRLMLIFKLEQSSPKTICLSFSILFLRISIRPKFRFIGKNYQLDHWQLHGRAIIELKNFLFYVKTVQQKFLFYLLPINKLMEF
ncbi:hypothetical protein BpHYR1_026129 [Brachionus plicatilis]|uniref:Uncharacterized protein n=1 Tax=Brachionus plicatilis TaxID=10195 RepID=A0A3M7T7B8_BRAPC|nr:hypothetical protein BpHYR1_026129 [Brachionus plicatilis]